MTRLPLAIAACALATFACTKAQANPSRDQLRTAEKINAILNGRRDWSELPSPCTAFATNKAMAFLLAGIDPKAVVLAVVRDERGGLHEVAEIVSDQQTTVYDSRLTWPASRKDLERQGYVWVAEFAANHTEESKP